MEINVTLNHEDDLEVLHKANASAVTIGAEGLSLRFEKEFNKEQVEQLVLKGKELGIKVYVALNKIIHNRDIPLLKEWLVFLDGLNIDALVFNDISVYQLTKTMKLDFVLHFDSDMMITNSKMANSWIKRGVKRVSIAKELTLDEYLEMTKNIDGEVEVLIQGLICMFHSIRPLVNHYTEYLERKELMDLAQKHNLHLYDDERDLNYPIVQDHNGTHIMSGKEICVIDDIHELYKQPIHTVKIDGFLQTREYTVEMTKLYYKAMQLVENDINLYAKERLSLYMEAQNVAKRPLDKGFLFKPTMYKVK
jgi:putative protease